MQMSRRNRQIILLSVLIALTLGFIWGNSLLPSEISSGISGSVAELVNKIFGAVFPGYSPSAEAGGDGLIRKLAHFTEFMVLGIELTVLVYRILRSNIVLPPFCGLLAALCDETIQLFSEGRGSKVSDVWIDFAGVMVGFLLVILISRKRSGSRENDV